MSFNHFSFLDVFSYENPQISYLFFSGLLLFFRVVILIPDFLILQIVCVACFLFEGFLIFLFRYKDAIFKESMSWPKDFVQFSSFICHFIVILLSQKGRENLPFFFEIEISFIFYFLFLIISNVFKRLIMIGISFIFSLYFYLDFDISFSLLLYYVYLFFVFLVFIHKKKNQKIRRK